MRLSAASEYALSALILIARRDSMTPIQGRCIAGELGIPHNFLLKVLQKFVHVGVLSSRVGCSGGFLLNKSLETTTLLEIIEIAEGQAAAFKAPNDLAFISKRASAILQTTCNYITFVTRDELRKVTLADLVQGDEATRMG